jgi:glucose uptake protein GlcU
VDDAADCLLVAFAVLDELNMPHPPLAKLWFALAAEGMWRDLRTLFMSLTVADDGSAGAVAMMQSGIVISIDGGVLLTQHRSGVRWVPMEMLRDAQWRRFL